MAAAAIAACLLALPAGAQTLRNAVEGAWRLNPEVKSLEARRAVATAQRGAGDVFGVSIRIPFSVKSVNASKRAEAMSEVVRAEAEQANAARTVESDIQQARQAHQAATERLVISRDRAAALRVRLLNVERARRGGEISLVEYVRVQETAFEADLARATAEVQVGAARARLNQSLGVLP